MAVSGLPAAEPVSALTFACPRCRAAVVAGTDGFTCAACGAVYPLVDGIPTFVDEAGYWGEIPAADMAWLVAEVERGRPWREAIAGASQPGIRAKAEFLLDARRSNWVVELPLPPAAEILDVGAGMGGVAAGLAPHAGRVVALEPVALRARFAAARVQQDGLKQVTVVRADAHTLPFPPRAFDVVVLSGVLEWLGKGKRHPQDAQLAVLRRIRELLRPGGVLVVGIENRIGIWYFFGRHDHSYLPFTSLLPRGLASLVTRVLRGHPYDTYTYTHSGYRRLFAHAGFDQMRTLLPIWSYNAPDFLLPVAPPGPRTDLTRILMGSGGRTVRRRWIRRLHLRLRLSDTFANDFVFFARSGSDPGAGLLADELKARWNSWGIGRSPERLALLVHNRSHPSAVVFADRARAPSIVARLAPAARADKATAARVTPSPPQIEIAALKHLVPLVTGSLAGSLPRPLDLFTCGPLEVGVTTYLEGEQPLLPGGDPLGRHAVRGATALIEAALAWLGDFHRQLAPDAPVRELSGRELIEMVGGRAPAALGTELVPRLTGRIGGAGSLGAAVRVPQHGDFVLSNVRLAGARVGVIDWERFGHVLMPGFDALHLVTYVVICLLADPRTQRVDPEAVLAHLLGPSPLGDALRPPLERYLTAQGLDPDALPTLHAAYLTAFVGEYWTDPARRSIVGTMAALLRTSLAS